jgi:protein tyrosine/serine phosphatase
VGKKKKQSLAALYIILVAIAAIILLVRHFHIKNFYIAEPDILYTSGQPRGLDYTRLLYKYHIATIVNVRSPAEHRDRNWYNEEIIWTRNSGVRYIEMPIDKNNPFPDQQTIDRFFDIMSDKTNLPVLLHGSGDDKRVAMLTAVWLRKNRKCTAEELASIVKKITDRHELPKAETEYIRSLTE